MIEKTTFAELLRESLGVFMRDLHQRAIRPEQFCVIAEFDPKSNDIKLTVGNDLQSAIVIRACAK